MKRGKVDGVHCARIAFHGGLCLPPKRFWRSHMSEVYLKTRPVLYAQGSFFGRRPLGRKIHSLSKSMEADGTEEFLENEAGARAIGALLVTCILP